MKRLQQSNSEPELFLCVFNLVRKCKKHVGKTFFSVQI